jgi:beta-1,4-mannosyl-glycoprotein beta-1,4-N-acetylglucosaminyltransferase
MKVFDVFLFCYELDILEIRLNLLDPYVDYFVISESRQTHSGIEKELYYQNNKKRFEKFNDKIIYNIIEEPLQEDLDVVSKLYDVSSNKFYQRDAYEKDVIKKFLEKHCNDDDIIIWSDLDEVPNPEVLSELNSFYQSDTVYNFAQENCQGYLNWVDTLGITRSQTNDVDFDTIPKWVGTKMCSYQILKKYTMTQMRRELPNENNSRIYPGGWHWSTVGYYKELPFIERAFRKIKTSSHHVEWNWLTKDIVEKRISENKDPLGRDFTSYTTIPFTSDNFPKYLIENKEKYDYLIKK